MLLLNHTSHPHPYPHPIVYFQHSEDGPRTKEQDHAIREADRHASDIAGTQLTAAITAHSAE